MTLGLHRFLLRRQPEPTPTPTTGDIRITEVLPDAIGSRFSFLSKRRMD